MSLDGLAVDALVAAHDAHRERPVRVHEPSSSRPIAPARLLDERHAWRRADESADRRAYRVSMTAVVQVDRTDDSTA